MISFMDNRNYRAQPARDELADEDDHDVYEDDALIAPPKLYTVCNHRHPVRLVLNPEPNNKCNGCMLPGINAGALPYSSSTAGIASYRCDACNFDLCKTCFDEFREISTRITAIDAPNHDHTPHLIARVPFLPTLSRPAPIFGPTQAPNEDAVIRTTPAQSIGGRLLISDGQNTPDVNSSTVSAPAAFPPLNQPQIQVENVDAEIVTSTYNQYLVELKDEMDRERSKLIASVCEKEYVIDTQKRIIKNLKGENETLNYNLGTSKGEKTLLQQKCDRLTATSDAINEMSMKDLVELESELKSALDRVGCKIKQKFDAQVDEKLCVVCLESNKNTLLLPCRHMCLCYTCSNDPHIGKCPICRVYIEQRIQVFF